MDTLQQLAQLNKVPLDMTLDSLRAVQRGVQKEDIGLQELLRKQQYEQQMDPLLLQAKQLENRGLGINNDQGLQTLQRQRREKEIADFTKDLDMQNNYKAALNKASDEDLKTALYRAQKMAFSDDPRVRAQGEAIFTRTKEAWLERQKNNNEMAKVGAQGRNAAEVARIGADSRVAAAGQKGAGKTAFPKSPKELASFYAEKARLAAEEGNSEEEEHFTNLSRDQWKLYMSELDRRGAANKLGGVDGAAVADVPRREGAPVEQMPKPSESGAGGGKPQQSKVYTMEQLRSRYPGIADDVLKNAAKAKGIEIK